MEKTSFEPEKNFFGVSLFGKNNIVSVVSEAYRQQLLSGAPEFYSEFQFVPFKSQKTLTELNAELPFRILREEGRDRISSIHQTELMPAELMHLEAHREMLRIYQEHQLEPLPPWIHTSRRSPAADRLRQCLVTLRKSVESEPQSKAEATLTTSPALLLGRIDPVFALEQAEWIRANIPVMQRANGSGKFYQNYVSFGFWNDSQVPLIRQFVELLRSQRGVFEEAYKKSLHLDYVYLSYVEDASQEICLWHKDGYWWDGQFHLTILGNSQILVRNGGLTMHIAAENGTVWYLNGSEYYHKIAQGYSGPRYELLAPCNLRKDSAVRNHSATVENPERWIDGNHPAIIEEIELAVNHMKRSISLNQASNLSVADWPVYGEGLKK